MTYGGTYSELTDPTRPGYTFDGWYTGAVDGTKVNTTDTVGVVAANTTLYAHWTATEYTITFKIGGDAADQSMTYNIESSVTLPVATRTGYALEGWYVEEAAGNWEIGKYNANDTQSSKYGNVTLVAKWDRAVTVVVEDYKYSLNTGYRLLRVAATGLDDGEVYKFGDEIMYYTTDKNYLIDANDTGVFYLLIADTNLVPNGNTYSNELTEEAYGKLTVATETRKELDYNGDINGDGVVNIADANVVYQMTQHGGSYYSMEQLDCEQRLLADMSKATVKADGNVADHRGSIEDVDAIITLING